MLSHLKLTENTRRGPKMLKAVADNWVRCAKLRNKRNKRVLCVPFEEALLNSSRGNSRHVHGPIFVSVSWISPLSKPVCCPVPIYIDTPNGVLFTQLNPLAQVLHYVNEHQPQNVFSALSGHHMIAFFCPKRHGRDFSLSYNIKRFYLFDSFIVLFCAL